MKKVISLLLSIAALCSMTAIPVNGEPTNIFGSEFVAVKKFTKDSLEETEIGSTGYKVSTNSSNYNNVVVMSNSTKTNEDNDYYPAGSGLSDNGFYLFFGSGGNGNVSATLTLPAKVTAGKYIQITYAKPYARNNSRTDLRNGDNAPADEIAIGGVTLDLKENCEFDKWYTSIVKADADISKLDITLGKWGAVAISDIKVLDTAENMMDLTAEGNKTIAYITPETQTIQYKATVYSSKTTLMDGTEVVTSTVDTNAAVTYSVTGDENVSIGENTGILTITSSAQEGAVTVTAENNGITKDLQLRLEAVGDADAVTIVGDEMVKKNRTIQLKALPSVAGTVIPERAAKWEIVGDDKGAQIADDGTLTAGTTAGNITVKATLKQEGLQTSENVSDTFTVTIKGEALSPYTIKGMFLTNCAADLTETTGLDGLVIDTDSVSEGYKAVVKAVAANGTVTASTEASLDSAAAGVSEVKTPLTFEDVEYIKAYIINSSDEVVSEEIFKGTQTTYRNVPIYPDWITGHTNGFGMNSVLLSPEGAPAGVNTETVDVSDPNVTYQYDSSYTGAETDNVLWYKEAAYLAKNGYSSNSIYDMHAADWEQKALPIGNGHMAGMLFGQPGKDQIQINEETFWAAGYRGTQTSVKTNAVNPNMSESINGYMSVGNIFVDFHIPKSKTVKNYYRDLNLDNATAHVRYEYDGVKYTREYFASYPKNVLVFRYTAEDGKLNFDVNPVSMHPGSVNVNNGEITVTGKLKDSEYYGAGGKAEWSQESDLEYCTKIRVIADDGEVTDGYNTVNVSGATGVTIIVAAATDYDKDRFVLDQNGNADSSVTQYKSARGVQAAIDSVTSRMNLAAKKTYAELKSEHIADYTSQFGKVKFSLTGDDEVCQTPTDVLQGSYKTVVSSDRTTKNVTFNEEAYNALDKHLEELHYNYARYMMISSSRSDTMPANLQGKWCQSTAEIWGSCYCININLEMNYWFAGGANLLDSGKALIGWFKSQIPAGTITARNYYKVTPQSYRLSGNEIVFSPSTDSEADDVFIMHTKQAIMGTTDLTGSTNIQSAGNTAWLMYNLWDLYQTSGDKKLLEEDLYPIMRKAVNFYTQYIYKNLKVTEDVDTSKYPAGYYYTTWEGRSPEQGPTHTGIKYDLQLVAGMYDYTIAAAETLGVDADKVAAWKEIRNHLEAPVELGDDGQIKEWAEETTYNQDADGNTLGVSDGHHRHISHLVGLYPGTLITRDDSELLNGAKIALKKRGDDSTGWSCSNKFLLWARTLNGDKALELFRYQLAQKTYSNLFDFHDPFQIDGNFGSAAGVMELLMQSQTGDIYILPALPTVWDTGEISGIKAKNGAEVSIKWNENKATEIKVVPASDGDITIGYDKGNIKSVNGQAIEFTNNKYTIKNAQKDEIYTFSTDSGSNIEREITTLTASHVTATGSDNNTLIVAGYNGNGVLQKCEVVNGLDSDLTGYDGCASLKAFLWNSLDGMKPYDCKQFPALQ